MSSGEQQIQCRSCRDEIPLDSGNCPNCGTSIRNLTPPVASVGVGLLVAAGSLTNLGDLWVYGLMGLVMITVGAFLIQDRRRRTQSV